MGVAGAEPRLHAFSYEVSEIKLKCRIKTKVFFLYKFILVLELISSLTTIATIEPLISNQYLSEHIRLVNHLKGTCLRHIN